jgi:dTDP-4-amino-4,6-dideoxygalactose transaminase
VTALDSDPPGSILDEPIRMARPQLGEEVERRVLEVLRSGQLAQGRVVERLEQLACEMAGSAYAVALCNGTAALEAALELIAEPGGEVVTSPLTFPATVNAILRTGLIARFADVRPDFTLDPESAQALVGPRTTVLLPVHLFGLTADMAAMSRLAERHGLPIVEDAAQAHGAEFDGRRAGSFGVGCFSLYATKNVAAGEGGLLTTSDRSLAVRARLLRNQGMDDFTRRPQMVGRNLRLTDVQAAIAVPQLERLEEITLRRQANADRLGRLLRSISGLRIPEAPPGRRHAWHQYTIILPAGIDRDVVRRRMLEAGVETAVHYPLLAWDHPAYRHHPGVRRDETPVARSLIDRWMSLPLHPGLQPGDLERIAEALDAAVHQSP